MVAGEVVHDRRDIEACHGEAQLDGVGNNSAAQVRLQNVPTLPRVKVAHDLRPYTQNARRKYRSYGTYVFYHCTGGTDVQTSYSQYDFDSDFAYMILQTRTHTDIS